MSSSKSIPLWLLGMGACFAACGAPPAPVSAPAVAASASAAPPATSASEPADEAVPSLRTGSIAPVDDPQVRELKVTMRHVANGYEILGAVLPDEVGSVQASADAVAGQPAALAFQGLPGKTGTRESSWLWIRRAVSASDVTGDLFRAASSDDPGKHMRFHVTSPGAVPSDRAALLAWVRALSFSLHRTSFAPWVSLAAPRLDHIADALDAKKKKANTKGRTVVRPRPLRPHVGELSGFLETTTGLTAVQEALQSDRTLWYAAPEHKATVALSSLQLPPLKHHPWNDMLARQGAPAAEPLAANVPAEFYYLRAAGLTPLLDLLDQLDTWGTAAGQVLEDMAQDRDLAGRYQTQLALRRGPLTRALGPAVVGEVALTGSDPYIEEGSDLTIVFRVKDRQLFDVALAATQAELEKDHGTLVHETRDHAGTAVRVSRSTDMAVGQQRASIGDLEIVSNSPHALDAVIDAAQGKRPRLADEADFRFMLARDPKEHADVLAFLGDRFVAEAVGPRQKILELRRQDALHELESLGAAAVLYGWIQGKSPKKVDDLVSAGLLTSDDLSHTSGEAITWQIGSAPRSVWGTPAAMTPLIDLPQTDKVSPDEKNAYEMFALGYQRNWSYYIDPVALRIGFDDGGGAGRRMTLAMRELPLIDSSDYRDILDFVGAARFTAQPVAGGFRVVTGIAQDSEVRRDVSHLFRSVAGDKLKLDWIGDWAAGGIADRASLAKVLLAVEGRELPQKPVPDERNSDDLGILATLPLYAEIAIKSPAQAALALAGARVLADTTIPGMFDWGEMEQYRGVSLVRIAIKGDAAKEMSDKSGEIDLFYAIASGALVITTQDWLLRRLVDERLDGKGPASATDPAGSAQFSMDLATRAGKGMWSSRVAGRERDARLGPGGLPRSGRGPAAGGARDRGGPRGHARARHRLLRVGAGFA
jgi:hypothetical protein